MSIRNIDPREKIIIPPGYIEIPADLSKYLSSDAEIQVRRSIRKGIFFVFNPENPEFKNLLEQCRIDTKALTKALHQISTARNIPIWVKRGKRPNSKNQYRRMGFLIRPPLFHSSEVDKKNHRLQQGNDQDVFTLHFDEAHNWQAARYWNTLATDDDRKSVTGTFNVFLRRVSICSELENVGPFFQENYGDWIKMATKIADLVEGELAKE